MAFLTNDKLVIVGAAGAIGSNMVQTALMMGLTSEICLYDIPLAANAVEGVAEEMRQSGFDEAHIVATTNVEEAFANAKYIISSGGAPRKAGMTREDLLAGNCKIAEELGLNITRSGHNPRRSGHHPSAERTGQEVRCEAERDQGLCHIRWSR